MMRYIIEETRIRILKYYTYSVASDEFNGLGPFILMDFIPGQRLDELLYSGDKFKSIITELQVKKVYEQITTIYIQLQNLEFNQIKRLLWDKESIQWYVRLDPLTIKQNKLKCHGIKVLGKCVFLLSIKYY